MCEICVSIVNFEQVDAGWDNSMVEWKYGKGSR